MIVVATGCSGRGGATPEEAVRGALDSLAHGNSAEAKRFMMTADRCHAIGAAPTCETAVAEMRQTFRSLTAIESYSIGPRITDLFGRPAFTIEVKLRGSSNPPNVARLKFVLYAQEVDGRYYVGLRDDEPGDSPSSVALPSGTATTMPAPSTVSDARRLFTVAELLEQYPAHAKELRGRKATVVGQYMGTDNWSSHPVSIGIVTDASASSVVSVTCSSMNDLSGVNPGDPIEATGELEGDSPPTLANCVARRR